MSYQQRLQTKSFGILQARNTSCNPSCFLFKRDFVNSDTSHIVSQTYGFHHIITLKNLEKSGLLRVQGGLWNYNTIRKSLRLIVEDINEKVCYFL